MTRSHAAAWCLVLLLGGLTASRSLAAHHGTLVSYDRDNAWTAKAVVTEFRYVNPHAQIYFDVGFIVVLVSLLVQGWTIAPAARWLRIAKKRPDA